MNDCKTVEVEVFSSVPEVEVVSYVTEVEVIPVGEPGRPGDIGPVGPVGPAGPAGPAGPEPSNATFVQMVPSDRWEIQHNFGRRPLVTVFDSSGDEVYADVSYPSSTVVLVEFEYPTTGSVQLD